VSGSERDGSFERHVHRRDAERRSRQHQAVLRSATARPDDLAANVSVPAGKMGTVLLNVPQGQDDQRIRLSCAAISGCVKLDQNSG